MSAAAKSPSLLKCVILPGIQAVPAWGFCWYYNLEEHLKMSYPNLISSVHLDTLPDAGWARDEHVLPWMEKHCDEHTIVIGHCSGARSILKHLEKHTLAAVLLVAPCAHTVPFNEHIEPGTPAYWDHVRAAVSEPSSSSSSFVLDTLDWAAVIRHVPLRYQVSCPTDDVVPFDTQLKIHKCANTVLNLSSNDEDRHFMGNRPKIVFDVIAQLLEKCKLVAREPLKLVPSLPPLVVNNHEMKDEEEAEEGIWWDGWNIGVQFRRESDQAIFKVDLRDANGKWQTVGEPTQIGQRPKETAQWKEWEAFARMINPDKRLISVKVHEDISGGFHNRIRVDSFCPRLVNEKIAKEMMDYAVDFCARRFKNALSDETTDLPTFKTKLRQLLGAEYKKFGEQTRDARPRWSALVEFDIDYHPQGLLLDALEGIQYQAFYLPHKMLTYINFYTGLAIDKSFVV